MHKGIYTMKRKVYLLTPNQESKLADHDVSVDEVQNVREHRRNVQHKRICMIKNFEIPSADSPPFTPAQSMCSTTINDELIFPRQLSFDDEGSENEYETPRRSENNIILRKLMLPNLSRSRASERRQFIHPKVSKLTRNVYPIKTNLPHILSVTSKPLSLSPSLSTQILQSRNETHSPHGILRGRSMLSNPSEQRIRNLVEDIRNQNSVPNFDRLVISNGSRPPQHLWIPEL
jgi:hypothetical protein